MSTSRRLTALAFAAALALAAAAPAEAARAGGRRAAATLERATAGESFGLTSWLQRLWGQVVAMFDEESGGNVPTPRP
ncbi:MAG: hypothetical protein AMXMBFR36_36730 [Acidobacteriota bacterium]